MSEIREKIAGAMLTDLSGPAHVANVLRRVAYPCRCGFSQEEARKQPCACSGVFYMELADDIEGLPERIEAALRATAEAHAASMHGIPAMPVFVEQAIDAGIQALRGEDERE